MGKIYLALALSFAILLVVNLTFIIVNLFFWATHGLQALLQGMNFAQRLYYSIYLKWIILADLVWMGSVLGFAFSRKNYKTNLELHYLSSKPIANPKVFVIIPAYNEANSIEKIVKEYKNQKDVHEVLVIDNHSNDGTPDIAEKCGAKVIRKESNRGYAHSCILGLKEALKSNTDIIVLTEADGTFSAHDIASMIPYLDNCDMVIGSRQVQVITEKGNQNSMFYIWGNLILAKLLQLKYFSLLHIGVVQLTDIGCSYRAIRHDSLEKIIEYFTYPDSDRIVKDAEGGLFALFMTMVAIENDLKIVEVPIVFKKRIGTSKSGVDKKTKGVSYGLRFLWFILTR